MRRQVRILLGVGHYARRIAATASAAGGLDAAGADLLAAAVDHVLGRLRAVRDDQEREPSPAVAWEAADEDAWPVTVLLADLRPVDTALADLSAEAGPVADQVDAPTGTAAYDRQAA